MGHARPRRRLWVFIGLQLGLVVSTASTNLLSSSQARTTAATAVATASACRHALSSTKPRRDKVPAGSLLGKFGELPRRRGLPDGSATPSSIHRQPDCSIGRHQLPSSRRWRRRHDVVMTVAGARPRRVWMVRMVWNPPSHQKEASQALLRPSASIGAKVRSETGILSHARSRVYRKLLCTLAITPTQRLGFVSHLRTNAQKYHWLTRRGHFLVRNPFRTASHHSHTLGLILYHLSHSNQSS